VYNIILTLTCTKEEKRIVYGKWACGSSMLQAGRSRVPFPIRSLHFFNWPNPSSRTVALRSTLTEMSTRNLPGGNGRSTREADLSAICEPIVYKVWELRRLTTLWASTACYRDSFFILCSARVFYLDMHFGSYFFINFIDFESCNNLVKTFFSFRFNLWELSQIIKLRG
jgi:hypothetical protein